MPLTRCSRASWSTLGLAVLPGRRSVGHGCLPASGVCLAGTVRAVSLCRGALALGSGALGSAVLGRLSLGRRVLGRLSLGGAVLGRLSLGGAVLGRLSLGG